MNSPWTICLMGSLRLQRGDQSITRFKSQKIASLLAYLAYHLHQAHPREVLIDLFWPDSTLEAGRNSLSVALSSLRNQLEPPGTPANSVLLADRFAVSLNHAAVTTDVQEFERAGQVASKTSSSAERVQNLSRAVELYQGRLLSGFYDSWITVEQERLSEQFFAAVSQLIGHYESMGDVTSALAQARQAIRMNPLREETHQHLIRLLAQAGQPGAALRQYKELERLLEEEMGEEPSPILRALVRQIEKQSGWNAPPVVPLTSAPVTYTPSVRAGNVSELPTTTNLLLTEICDLLRLRERSSDAASVLTLYRGILREACALYNGQEVETSEGTFCVAFPTARQALLCAVAMQQTLSQKYKKEASDSSLIPHPSSFCVRMGLHTGDLALQEGRFQGSGLHKAERILTAGHGGQILCSEATMTLVRGELPTDIELVDLGLFRLRETSATERLFQVNYPQMPERDFPPLSVEAGYASTLPLRLTRFFGREQELEHITGLLRSEEVHLLTLTGPGGTGKTRLSLEVAERLVDAFQGAVWFISLADITDTRLIADTVLNGLPIPRSSQRVPIEQVVEFLSRQPSLLALDNFEHLVEGGAEVVQTLLERVPSLTILVTSRQLLGLSGEREFAVAPLPTPNGGEEPERLSLFDSVRLFVDRAQAVTPYFQVTENNAPAIAELCIRLEGIPLAIELAAARVQVFTPAQMLAQLQNRFAFLSTRKRDVSERHRTLRAAIEWSYRLLSPELQQFFSCLSVFRGGCTAEAAEMVCEEPLALDYLAQLRECSLVLSDETWQEMRFRMLETIREYGAEQMSEEECYMVRVRQRDFFLAMAETYVSKNEDATANWTQEAVRRIEADYENFQAVFAWCQANEGAEYILRFGNALWFFWNMTNRPEECRYIDWALQHAVNIEPGLRAAGMGHLAYLSSDEVRARQLCLEAVELARQAGDKSLAAWLLNSIGQQEEAMSLYQEIGDVEGIMLLHRHFGTIALMQCDYSTARSHLEQGGAGEPGNPQNRAHALYLLGGLLTEQGDYTSAYSRYQECLTITRNRGHWKLNAVVTTYLANAMLSAGQLEEAQPLLEEGMAFYRHQNDLGPGAYATVGMAEIYYAQGKIEAARSMAEESVRLFRQALGFGHHLPKALKVYGRILLQMGSLTDAYSAFREGLEVARNKGKRIYVSENLEGMAPLAASDGKSQAAVRLLGASHAIRDSIQAPIRIVDAPGVNAVLEMLKRTLGDEAFDREWKTGVALSEAEALTFAFALVP